jgi:hypothetical protein
VTNIFPGGGSCPFSPTEWSVAVCGNLVITFGDDNFAIGVSDNYTTAHGNAAGWPQQANYGGTNYWVEPRSTRPRAPCSFP